MINGKQVRTKYTYVRCSQLIAQTENIVTAGRDKTVSFGTETEKPCITISRFADIVMETRLSHDGSKNYRR